MVSKHRLQQQVFVFLLVLSFVHSKCNFGGKTFESYRVVYNFYNEKHDWCSVGLCKEDGKIWKLVDLNCGKKSHTETTKAITTLPETAGPGARCIYEGKEYSRSSEIFRGFDELKGVCYTIVCTINGEVVTRDRKRCKTTEQLVTEINTLPVVEEEYRAYSTQKPDLEHVGDKGTEITTPFSMELITNSPQNQTIATKPPSIHVATPIGCFVDGKFFPHGSQVSEGYDEQSDWCYGQYCSENGELVSWDTWNCKRKLSTTQTRIKEVTTPPVRKSGCHHNGKFYSLGEEISEDYDKQKGLCRLTYCGDIGEVSWYDAKCKGARFTTDSHLLTTPRGCYHNNKRYYPGQEISTGYDENTDHCYGTYCQESGSVISWDDWNCKRGKGSPPTTAPPMEHTTLPPRGCYDNGVLYRPGEKISEGYDESSDWCYGTYCDENSDVVSWDSWNCKQRTTYPPTTQPVTMTMARKCKYGSSLYNNGDKVYEKYDKQSNWCYGLFCSSEGQLVYWDKWNCKEVATPSVPLLQKVVRTDMGSSAGEKSGAVRCLYKGKEYFSRQVIKKDCTSGNRCKVLFCNHRGIVVPKLLKDLSRTE